jgi:hypothetical protein
MVDVMMPDDVPKRGGKSTHVRLTANTRSWPKGGEKLKHLMTLSFHLDSGGVSPWGLWRIRGSQRERWLLGTRRKDPSAKEVAHLLSGSFLGRPSFLSWLWVWTMK